MIRGLGDIHALDLFSNFKWVCLTLLIKLALEMILLSGPVLVSRTGDEGCS